MSKKQHVLQTITPTEITKDNKNQFNVTFEHEGKEYGLPKEEVDADLFIFKIEAKDEMKNTPISEWYGDENTEFAFFLDEDPFPSSGVYEAQGDEEEGEKEEEGKGKSTQKYKVKLALFKDEDNFVPTLREAAILAICETHRAKYYEFLKKAVAEKKISIGKKPVDQLEHDIHHYFRMSEKDEQDGKDIAQLRLKASIFQRKASNPKNKVKGVPDIFTKFKDMDDGGKNLTLKDMLGKSGHYIPYFVFNRMLICKFGHCQSFTLKTLLYNKADVKEGKVTDVYTDSTVERALKKKAEKEKKSIIEGVIKEKTSTAPQTNNTKPEEIKELPKPVEKVEETKPKTKPKPKENKKKKKEKEESEEEEED